MFPHDIQLNQVIGRWTILCRENNKRPRFLCRCECGIEKSIDGWNLANGRSKGCSACLHKYTRGDKHPNWKGFAVVRGDHGYVRIRNAEYPGATFPNRTYEHIVVMSLKLNRPLLPDEEVHHKNGVRHDNREDNLELWVKPQPSGIRAEDALAWAKEIIQRYGHLFSNQQTLNQPEVHEMCG